MEIVNCISCENEIRIMQQPTMGMMVHCSDCGAELEVVWLDPVELDWPYIDDWDEEEDEEYISLYEDE